MEGWFKPGPNRAGICKPLPPSGRGVRVLRRMKALAVVLQSRKKAGRTAIGHGDFHPNNLIVSDTGVRGIDLGGSSRIPIYKDYGRFLNSYGSTRVTMSALSDVLAWMPRPMVIAFVTGFGLLDRTAGRALAYLS